ncbi:MAG: 5-formyltetrahydrofolate cyclo-ligase [Desulfobacteraceae bacterium]|nr:5-formyltetrahydrofolate cyclo-ligase [Desulfobacteraceae bacterium]
MSASPAPTYDQRLRWRQETLARRDRANPAAREAWSRAIAVRLAQLPQIKEAQAIFTYVHFRSEVETLGLIAAWLAAGKRVCVPLTIPAERRLAAYWITTPARDVAPGYCRIPEPDPQRTALANPKEIEIVILPGSVFDLSGGRLGYGGGFYDRFLADQAPQALRVGLAFELQVTKRLPLLAHDQPLDLLVTEDRLLSFPRRDHVAQSKERP